MVYSNFQYRKLLHNHILLIMSAFGRDAFATLRYVTLLNVSEIRDISNDERKVPFKNDDYLASGTSSFRKACKSIIRDNKI